MSLSLEKDEQEAESGEDRELRLRTQEWVIDLSKDEGRQDDSQGSAMMGRGGLGHSGNQEKHNAA